MRISNDSLSKLNVDISTTPVSLGASFNLDPVWLGHIVNYSIQLVFTGTPEGTWSLQASNDMGVEDRNNGGWNGNGVTNWTTIDDSQAGISEAGSAMWTVENCGYRWVRVVYTRTASTGSLTVAKFNCKGI
jgi:hypothetical protein